MKKCCDTQLLGSVALTIEAWSPVDHRREVEQQRRVTGEPSRRARSSEWKHHPGVVGTRCIFTSPGFRIDRMRRRRTMLSGTTPLWPGWLVHMDYRSKWHGFLDREGGLPQVPCPNPAPFRVRGFEHTAPPRVGTREHGSIAHVRGTPPRVLGTPLGPISQCIDTKRGTGFGIPLRKYTGSARRQGPHRTAPHRTAPPPPPHLLLLRGGLSKKQKRVGGGEVRWGWPSLP